MKLNKLRDQLRKAKRARPEAFTLPEDDETLNCASCGGKGVVQRGLDDVRGHQCEACGGTGLRLAGEKAAPSPRKTNKLTTRVADALAERLTASSSITDLRVTLVSEHPGDLRAAPTLDHLDPDTILTGDAVAVRLAKTATGVKMAPVVFKPEMFQDDKRGFPIVAAVVSSERTILGVIDLARGGIGVINTGADITIDPSLELAT